MVENMSDSTLKTKNMDSENSNGQMAENTKDYGKMENNTEKEFTLMLKEKRNKENGLMVKELNGLMMIKKKNDLTEIKFE